jgi:hypothetical protein
MYAIEKTLWGYKLTFGDFIQNDEMTKWVDESKTALEGAPAEFGVFVDMRSLKPLPEDAKETMTRGQKLYKEKGMVRSVVILDNPVTTMQFKRIAKESGIDQWERYIDASSHPDWEAKGVAWVKEGTDPDAN